MGPLFSLMILLVLGAVLFVPTMIVALAMRIPAGRAFVLAATFSLGAVVGAIATVALMDLVLSHGPRTGLREIYDTAFFAAGATAGGVISLWLVSKLGKSPPWRRD